MRSRAKMIGAAFLLLVLALLGYPALRSHPQKARLAARMSTLRQIGLTCAMYRDLYPETQILNLAQLRSICTGLFAHGVSPQQYELLSQLTTNDAPFIRETTPDEQGLRCIGFMDGHVEAWPVGK